MRFLVLILDFILINSAAKYGHEYKQDDMIKGISHGESPSRNPRLPGSLLPYHYNLAIKPILNPEKEFPLEGQVQIYFHCKISTNQIILNIKQLDIDNSSVQINHLQERKTTQFDSNISKRSLSSANLEKELRETDSTHSFMTEKVDQDSNDINYLLNTSSSRRDEKTVPNIINEVNDKGINSYNENKPDKRNSITESNHSVFIDHYTSLRHGIKPIKSPCSKTNDQIRVEYLEYWNDVEQVALHLNQNLEDGTNYSLVLKYSGQLVHQKVARGFYWTSYDYQDETRYLAASHFSPADARRAFPCFDEPAMKATFNVSVWRKSPMTSLSNMPLRVSEHRYDDWYVDHYLQSPVMSTYLVAFVICDFPYRKLVTKQGYTVRVWTRPAGLTFTDYALQSVEKLISYFENYTGIPYTLPKLDLISIPDHPVSAMENWGLMTFKESSLWHDKTDSLSSHLIDSTATLAHEIAHMWFGNLVTPIWWDDLWLKESFATFFTYSALAALHKDWRKDELFVNRCIHRLLQLDSASDTKPIVQQVDDPKRLLSVFTHQAYAKGASLLRTLELLIGTESFDACIKTFLNKYRFSSASRKDLWKTCKEVFRSRKADAITFDQYEHFMENWLTHPGYPLINVSFTSSNIITTQQHRYVDKVYFDVEHRNNTSQLWQIPFTLSNSEHLRHDHQFPWYWLSNDSAIYQINHTRHNAMAQLAFYRVNYDTDTWRNIARQLRQDYKVYDTVTRAMILNDAFQFARHGDLSETLALDQTLYMRHEKEWLPWETVIVHLQHLLGLFTYSNSYNSLKEYLLSRLVPVYHYVGWRTDDQFESIHNKLLRYQVVWLACELGYKPCISHALRLFDQWLTSKFFSLHPDIRNTVLCTGIRHGSSQHWEQAMNKLKSCTTENERTDLVNCMACTDKKQLLNRYATLALTPGYLDDMEALNALAALSANRHGKHIVWKHVKKSWKDFPIPFAKGGVLLTLASKFASRQELNELAAFRESESNFFFADILHISEKMVQSNILWRETNEQLIEEWLRQHENEYKRSSYNLSQQFAAHSGGSFMCVPPWFLAVPALVKSLKQ